MRVLVAGAGGAVGQQLIPLLTRKGHTVGALLRSEYKREALLAMGATPFFGDALDAKSIQAIVEGFYPDAIINQLTAIPQVIDLAHYERDFELTNRLRTEGTDNLIAAAKKGNVKRFVAQGFAGSSYERTGSAVKTEEDLFDPDPPKQLRSSFAALRHLESSVLGSFPESGVVLRYGWFYGPGTSLARNGPMAQAARKRMLPVVAGGTGVWSFLHIEDAASAALAALEEGAGIYNVADDEPALVRDWISTLAGLVEAKPPYHIPAWMARMAIRDHGVAMMRDNRGLSTRKVKRELNWFPRYPNWRDGFANEFAEHKPSHSRCPTTETN
jgi:2-alkyl-3-oxoalkanoate reductase